MNPTQEQAELVLQRVEERLGKIREPNVKRKHWDGLCFVVYDEVTTIEVQAPSVARGSAEEATVLYAKAEDFCYELWRIDCKKQGKGIPLTGHPADLGMNGPGSTYKGPISEEVRERAIETGIWSDEE